MNFNKGNNRYQLVFSTFEIQSQQDYSVHFVDALVERLDMSQLGCVVSALKIEARLAFESIFFLKIYLSEYLNWIRLVVAERKNSQVQWNCNVVTTAPS